MKSPVQSRRSFLQTAAGGALACLTSCTSPAQAARPNVVFILMDDMGWADVGINGSDFYETPNIDRLAAQGMQFTNAYAACPVCSPTRASILSGKYPARLKLTNFIPGPWRRTYAKVVPPAFEQQLALEEVTIAEALKGAGYTSACIGKWHLGGESHYPDKQGFDFQFLTSGGHSYPKWKVNRPHEPREGEYRWERLTEEAGKFMERSKEQPFFLYVPYHLVHIPLDSKQELIAKYEAKLNTPKFKDRRGLKEPAQNNPIYAAMMESADQCVGAILNKIEELDLASNTVVFFMSDNGGLSSPEWENHPVTSNAPLREGKGHLYEGGIRDPLIVRWPGTVKADSICSDPVSSVDFYPTIAEMAGAQIPAGRTLDGVSLMPLLKQTGKLSRDAIYWHYPHYSNQGGDPGAAVRQGDFKLIEFYDDNRLELYDLKNDIGEKNNLAAKMPEKAEELHKLLRAWLKEVDAAMPTKNPNYNPARHKEGLRWIKPKS